MIRTPCLKSAAASRRRIALLALSVALCAAPAVAATPPAPLPTAKAARTAKATKSPARPVASPYARAAEHQARAPQAVGGQTPTPSQAFGQARHSPRAAAKRH